MIIGVLKEQAPGETRVAATPATVQRIRSLGYEVVVEPGAGAASDFPDAAYVEHGAKLGDPLSADIVLAVNAPPTAQLDRLPSGATLVAILRPALNPDLVADLARRPITALAIDAVPRISRAQSLDALSAMANIAGYRAVVEAAHEFGRFFTGQVTAAGKVTPAQVLVAGAGVAGLAAIGAAGSLGAVVRATDPRPEVADQVRSLGGEYLAVPSADVEVSTTGYAKEMSQDYKDRASALYAATLPETDIAITTALIPGKLAPRLITAEMVDTMKPGSVIVDMAAASGGNVEGTVPGEAIVTEGGVTIIGYTDLAARLPAQASQMYGTNLVNLLALMTPEKNGKLVVDLDDVVVRSITVVRDGELMFPPPPVQVSMAPATQEPATQEPLPTSAGSSSSRRQMSPGRGLSLVLASAAGLFGLVAISPPALQAHLTVFALAIVIGYYVIGHVHHALHTPLMSVTNAISGIIVVGAVLQIGHVGPDGGLAVTVLSSAAILLASINIFGGFAVTHRMLAMFSRS